MPGRNSPRGHKRKAMVGPLAVTLLVFILYAGTLASLIFLQDFFTELAADFGYGQADEVWLALVLAANILLCPLALLLLYFLAGAFSRRRLRLAFRAIKGRDIVALLKNFSIHFGFLLIIGIIVALLSLFGLKDFFDFPEQDIDLLLLGPWLPALLLAVAVPILEEGLFRGFLYARLRGSFKFWPAFLVSGLLFSLLHLRFNLNPGQNIFVVANIFLLTFFITKTFEETQNLWMPIIFHGLHNGRVVLVLFLVGLIE